MKPQPHTQQPHTPTRYTQNPFDHGVNAALAGRPLRANPYSYGSNPWMRWLSGWNSVPPARFPGNTHHPSHP